MSPEDASDEICFYRETLTDLAGSNHWAIFHIDTLTIYGYLTNDRVTCLVRRWRRVSLVYSGQWPGWDWMLLMEPMMGWYPQAGRGSTIYLTKSNMLDKFVL
jgi:hypothetical protein